MSDDAGDLFDPESLLTGRARGRSGRLLYLLESWPGATESSVLDFLVSIDLFAGLAIDDLRDLLGELEPVVVPAGEAVIRQGELADFLAIVAHGRLRVGDDARERGSGQIVGEGALLTAGPALVPVIAVRDSLVLRLSASSFQRFGERHPRVLLQLCRQLVTTPPPAPASARSIAIVPLTPGATVAAELVQALCKFGPAVHVKVGDVERVLGPGASQITSDDPRNAAVLAWAQGLEKNHPFVVYEVDGTPGPWQSRCLRQADLVLLVVGSRGRPSRTAPVHSLARRELVFLHDAGTVRPSGTAAWLEAVPVASYHHLRLGVRADVDRLARAVANRSIAVVLSGGGARGIAHLGVLRALDEIGVPVDAVGGASIGSLIGAVYAGGWDHETRVTKVMNGFRRWEILRPTLPVVSISSSAVTTRRIAHELEGARIEDFWRPFFAVSANISRAQLVVHDRGEAWRAVRTSISLPGIFPPVFHDGDLLIDGGVLNNLPVDVMQQRMPGAFVVGVELFRPVDLRVERPFEPTVSGWQALRHRLRIPSPPTVVMRSSELQSVRLRDEVLAAADVLLRPPTEGYGLLDFDKVRPLVESSYRWTMEELERTGLGELLTTVSAARTGAVGP